MIRLIGRRLIIPRGDTGSFTIPTQGTATVGDIAVFALYDPLYHTTVLEIQVSAGSDTIEIPFVRADTAGLTPKKYEWDITVYKAPKFDEEGKLVDGQEINSYYSAFKLPICEIREVTGNV